MKKHAQFNLDCHFPISILVIYLAVAVFAMCLVSMLSTQMIAKQVSFCVFCLFGVFTVKLFLRSQKAERLICTKENVFVVLSGVEHAVSQLRVHIANQFFILLDITPSAELGTIKPIKIIFIKRCISKKDFHQLLLSIRTGAIGKAIQL